MSKFDWKAVIGTVAPTIATALGGPLAGVAVKTLAAKLLGKPDAPQEEVEAAVAGADSATLLRLKEIDIEFKKFVTDSGIKLEQIAAGDRASAREREIQTGDYWTMRVLATVVVGGFLFAMFAVLSGYISSLKDPLSIGIAGSVIGYASAKADQVVSYYFGSSASSRAKDDTLSHIAKME